MKTVIFGVLSTLIAVQSWAMQTQPTEEHLKAKVIAISGNVQVKEDEKGDWKPAAVGQEVGENAEFRTSFKSSVQFSFPPDQIITLDRLSTVKVVTAVNQSGFVKTQLGMKYGRARYEIEAAGREHEASIASPSNTLAVRGTDFVSEDQRPFPAQAISYRGRVEFRDFKKRIYFGSRAGGKTVINANDRNAASTALNQTIVDPGLSLARSQSEDALVNTLLSRGATVSFDYDRGIRVVRGGTVPQNDNELIPTLPGTFNVVMRWQGNADLNLGVISPNPSGNPNDVATTNLSVYPLAGFDLVPSGGQIPFDHRGGPNGGIEVAFWPGTFPAGAYFIGAQWMSGQKDVAATVDVFKDGKRVPITTGAGDVTTANFIGNPIDPNIGSGIGVGTVRFATGTPGTTSGTTTPKMAGPKPAAAPAPLKRAKR
jgi:hypothetical protein